MATYVIKHEISGLAAARTLAYLTAAANRPLRVVSTHVTNGDNETSEQCQVQWQKITNLGTPTATAKTPTPLETGAAAAAMTAAANVTASEPTYETAHTFTFGSMGFPSLYGYHYQPTAQERKTIPAGESWGLKLVNAPTAFLCIFEIVVEELG